MSMYLHTFSIFNDIFKIDFAYVVMLLFDFDLILELSIEIRFE